jgi:hypothetical protein
MADDPVIDRDEVVALLFNVSDIAETLANIERLLGGENDGEEEADEG